MAMKDQISKQQRDEINILLDHIISKGKLFGQVAEFVKTKGDPNQFLLACYYDCNSDAVQRLWSRDFIDRLIAYSVKYNDAPREIPISVFELTDKIAIFQYKRPPQYFNKTDIKD